MTSQAWPSVRLGDHCSKIGSGATPRGGESVYIDAGVSFIRSQNIYNGQFERGGLAYLDEGHADQLKGVTVESGDVLLNITGDSVARSCRIPEEILPARVSQHVAIIRPNRDAFDPRFIGYWLISPLMQDTMLSLAGSGGTRKALTKEMIERLEVPRPPRSTQSRIADVLVAYDDLIENNQRRATLLEDTTKQLYREWFMRFRFPGHEHARITDGTPAGWRRESVEELTSYINRGIAPQYDDSADGRVINQKCIRDRRIDLALSRRQSREFKPERQVKPGDVLVNSTGEGTLGRVAQVIAPIENCTVDTHVTIVRPTEGIGTHYFGHALMEWEPRFATMGRGATNQTELSRAQIGEAEILVPPDALVQQFEDAVAPAFRQIWNLTVQVEKLRAARDLLLPRLMSGEIRV